MRRLFLKTRQQKAALVNNNTVSKNGGFHFKDFYTENTITCKYKDKGKEGKHEEHYQYHLLENPSYWTYSFCHHSLSDK